MSNDSELKTVYAGKHLSMVSRGTWEFATRNTNRPAVGIMAITDEDRMVLVEQFRPPAGESGSELPAGLAGDVPGAEDEELLAAAQRELLEETGYIAGRWTRLASGYSSPGLTDESIVLFLAEDLEKTDDGGGDDSEDITVHEIPRTEVLRWLRERDAAVDLKLLAGLYVAEAELRGRAQS